MKSWHSGNIGKLILLVLASVLLNFGCGTANKSTDSVYDPSYTIKFKPNSEVEYEGNLIVKLIDASGNELIGGQIQVLTEEGKLISQLTLSETSLGVFYVEERELIVIASKDNYENASTELVMMSPVDACFVNLKLRKK